jgi:bifunctional non-homologous end joining protein LigD
MARSVANAGRKAAKPAGRAGQASSRDVKFTNTDRVVYPEAGYTKGDVLEFYLKVAPKLLPHLRDRPMTLERLPEGVREGAPHFWQKNTPAYYPRWIPRVKLPTLEGKPVDYLLVNDVESLLYLVNQNVLTFHTWMSRISDPDRPDYVLFDIDPHQSTFANAVKVSKVLHAMLDDEGVDNFIKTSGKSGLHVLVPWDGTFDESRAWAEELADRVARELPRIATTERTIAKRGSRVYVDAMQNAKGKHVVPPYVLRAAPAATVSMPLAWKELTPTLTPKKFELRAAQQRITRQKNDPLAALAGD